MIEEANTTLKLFPPAAYMYYEQIMELKQFHSGMLPIFVHPSLYRALKLMLMFPGDIGSLSLEGAIKTEMRPLVGVLTPAMFNPWSHP